MHGERGRGGDDPAFAHKESVVWLGGGCDLPKEDEKRGAPGALQDHEPRFNHTLVRHPLRTRMLLGNMTDRLLPMFDRASCGQQLPACPAHGPDREEVSGA